MCTTVCTESILYNIFFPGEILSFLFPALMGEIFIPQRVCQDGVNDYIEVMATSTAWQKINFYFCKCNGKFGWLGEIAVQRQFFAVQYVKLTCTLLLIL